MDEQARTAAASAAIREMGEPEDYRAPGFWLRTRVAIRVFADVIQAGVRTRSQD